MTPQQANTERYDAYYRHYLDLYQSTVDTQHFLAEQQRIADA